MVLAGRARRRRRATVNAAAAVAVGGRRRVRGVLQNEVAECGAACLVMILGRFGRWISLEEARYAAGVSRDGVKASNIVKAAAFYGLKGRGISCSAADLFLQPLPAVAFWNFNHFVVVEGRRGKRIFLNDPALGPRTVSEAEFDESFTGVALTFAATPEFRKEGRPARATAAVMERLAPFGAALAALALAGFFLLIPGLVAPGLQRSFIDFYLVRNQADWLLWLTGGLGGAAAVKMLITWFQRHHLARFNVRLGLKSNGELIRHMLRLPMGFFAQRNVGELANRAALADRLSGLLTGSLVVAVVNLLAITVYGAVMLAYDWRLTALVVAFAALSLGCLVALTGRLSSAHSRVLQEDARLQTMLVQGFASLESFKATGTEDLFFRRWAGGHAKVIAAEQGLTRARRLLANAAMLLTSLTTIAVLLFGGERVMDGTLSIGMLVAFQALMASFNAPVASLVNMGGQLQDARGYAQRLDDVLHQPADPLLSPGRAVTALASVRGHLELDGVAFAYARVAQPVLADVTLSVRPGERVALVGPSGSGKSTLGRLIAGMAVQTAGDIRLDGVAMAGIDTAVLRSGLAYVEQSIALFPGSMRDNITLWNPAISEERVAQAAKDAALHDVIAGRPNAYDSLLDEEGKNLSGGERQRLAIARALAADPALIVLDEPTSALDAIAEKTILDNIRRRGCACVIVSHRLSAIRDCDRIVVLDRGRIVADGRHASLIETSPLYRRLVES